MSDIREATVRGAVELTAGADGLVTDFFREDFFAAGRRRVAEWVAFFFDLVCEGSGTAAIDARRTTAIMRSFRYSIDFSERYVILQFDGDNTRPNANSTPELPTLEGQLKHRAFRLGKRSLMG